MEDMFLQTLPTLNSAVFEHIMVGREFLIQIYLWIYNILYQSNHSQMSDPIFNWPMKTIKFIFGQQRVIQLQNAKFLYTYNDKTAEIVKARQKMVQSFTWNIGIGLAFAVISNALLQKAFPAYRKIGFTSVILDGGIFTLWGSVMGVYTLNQLQPQVQPFRKKWIVQLNPDYVKVMRFLNKFYEIRLQDQIGRYINPNDQLSWKMRFDSIV